MLKTTPLFYKFQYYTSLGAGAMPFRSYKNNLLLAGIDISSCNYQFYFFYGLPNANDRVGTEGLFPSLSSHTTVSTRLVYGGLF